MMPASFLLWRSPNEWSKVPSKLVLGMASNGSDTFGPFLAYFGEQQDPSEVTKNMVRCSEARISNVLASRKYGIVIRVSFSEMKVWESRAWRRLASTWNMNVRRIVFQSQYWFSIDSPSIRMPARLDAQKFRNSNDESKRRPSRDTAVMDNFNLHVYLSLRHVDCSCRIRNQLSWDHDLRLRVLEKCLHWMYGAAAQVRKYEYFQQRLINRVVL